MSPSKEFNDFIAHLRSNPLPFDQFVDIADVRAAFDALGTKNAPPPDVIVRAVDAAGVPAQWIEPQGSEPSRVILYLHGGGYVAGNPSIYRNFVIGLCRASGSRALVIDYRLAPEHPFPAALEDAQRSYAWLLGQGVSPDHIVMAGDSAGGGLAVATLVALRDEGQPMPAAAILLSPWTDLTLQGESHVTKVHADPIITRSFSEQNVKRYVGSAVDSTHPLVSPLLADLRRLPPLLVVVGTAEVLMSDSTRLVHKAREAGVDVELIEGDQMVHTWPFFAPAFPEATEAVREIGSYIRGKIG